jgi:hypothetical protein
LLHGAQDVDFPKRGTLHLVKRRDAGTAAREIPVLPKFRRFLMDVEALQIVAERLKAKDSIRDFGKLFQN